MEDKEITAAAVQVSQERVGSNEDASATAATKEGAKAKTVRNAELYTAIHDTKINYKSKESIHLYCKLPRARRSVALHPRNSANAG
ncbi:hypothetical protein AAE478_007461 [Parahypoxylon ruwenzoriense]